MAEQSIRDVAVRILRDARREMHISEITERVRREIKIHSKTPQNSVNNALQKDEHVERVGSGTFRFSDKGRRLRR